jgi:hypothetical protein
MLQMRCWVATSPRCSARNRVRRRNRQKYPHPAPLKEQNVARMVREDPEQSLRRPKLSRSLLPYEPMLGSHDVARGDPSRLQDASYSFGSTQAALTETRVVAFPNL